MFENLKAFIRHGKQANDMRKKPLEIGTPTLIDNNLVPQQYVDYSGLSNLPAGAREQWSAQAEAEAAALAQAEAQAQARVQAQAQAQALGPASAPAPAPALAQAEAEPQAQTQVAPAEAATYHPAANEYQDAATQIVEQENLMRQKGTSYPMLDNYVIMEQMGEGAFSVVCKAQNRTTGQYVAIKILRKFQMDLAQKQLVLKEVTIMRQLNHHNIVKFIEFIDSDQYYYIVQELVVGGEIFTAIVKFTYLSEDLLRHVIRQVAAGIRYLHEEVGIVHRDIKPENILYSPIELQPLQNPVLKLRKSDDPSTKQDEGEFTPGVGGGGIGEVKLADFGLLKQIWEHNTKTPCGTVGYTAPEIVRDERYSKEVDMWAIGCVLYTLLCGFPPFYDERIETLTEKVARGEYTFLTPWWDEILPLAKNCVSRLLTVDPNQRYTIDEFINDPWMKMGGAAAPPPARKSSASAGNVAAARYSKKYMNSGLYSPAAVAMRDAFDISAAVHRMGEEAALHNRFGNAKDMQQLMEEEEEEERVDEEVDRQGHVMLSVPRKAPRFQQKQNIHDANPNPPSLFDLDLGGASILERRKNKPLPINI